MDAVKFRVSGSQLDVIVDSNSVAGELAGHSEAECWLRAAAAS